MTGSLADQKIVTGYTVITVSPYLERVSWKIGDSDERFWLNI